MKLFKTYVKPVPYLVTPLEEFLVVNSSKNGLSVTGDSASLVGWDSASYEYSTRMMTQYSQQITIQELKEMIKEYDNRNS